MRIFHRRTMIKVAAASSGAMLAVPAQAAQPKDPESIVTNFLADVRSGRDPDAAPLYFAPRVQAHQVTAEGLQTVVRTPGDYARHVREFLRLFGRYRLTVEEVLPAGDKVFVRWRQDGCHCGSVAREAPTGGPLVELTSVVYRVHNSHIVEYWLQTDRKGLEVQLERLKSRR